MLSSGSGTSAGNAAMPPPGRPRWRRWRAILLATGLAVAMFGVGFLWFVRQMPAAEAAPPRTMTELTHQLPGVTLVPFPVTSDRVRVDAWWSSPAIARLLFSEYLKYIAAVVRTRLDFASA